MTQQRQMTLEELERAERAEREPVSKVHAFSLRYEPPGADGEPLVGTFEVRAPSRDDRARIGRYRALLAGAPWEWLDPESRAWFDALARLHTLITSAPKWFKLSECDDPALIYHLVGEVTQHEARYFRADGGEGEGGGGGRVVTLDAVRDDDGPAEWSADGR